MMYLVSMLAGGVFTYLFLKTIPNPEPVYFFLVNAFIVGCVIVSANEGVAYLKCEDPSLKKERKKEFIFMGLKYLALTAIAASLLY